MVASFGQFCLHNELHEMWPKISLNATFHKWTPLFITWGSRCMSVEIGKVGQPKITIVKSPTCGSLNHLIIVVQFLFARPSTMSMSSSSANSSFTSWYLPPLLPLLCLRLFKTHLNPPIPYFLFQFFPSFSCSISVIQQPYVRYILLSCESRDNLNMKQTQQINASLW